MSSEGADTGIKEFEATLLRHYELMKTFRGEMQTLKAEAVKNYEKTFARIQGISTKRVMVENYFDEATANFE
ncbi:hypothetical protein QR680_018995 [Steinernema hermaphroditum]|uniref:Uncharacterized protein n=1 Tax=Steinernema hermaphroditum TaxID=289476 RepID=A0AA39HLU7_9BILA|nr:hypothetical protein QR680_018995 [Steinernema hermaphroditum]